MQYQKVLEKSMQHRNFSCISVEHIVFEKSALLPQEYYDQIVESKRHSVIVNLNPPQPIRLRNKI